LDIGRARWYDRKEEKMENTYTVQLTGEFLSWFSGTESRLLTGTKPALLAIREAAQGFLQLCGPGFDSSPGERRGCREAVKRINRALGEEES
jgi:hypothetical protein